MSNFGIKTVQRNEFRRKILKSEISSTIWPYDIRLPKGLTKFLCFWKKISVYCPFNNQLSVLLCLGKN